MFETAARGDEDSTLITIIIRKILLTWIIWYQLFKRTTTPPTQNPVLSELIITYDTYIWLEVGWGYRLIDTKEQQRKRVCFRFASKVEEKSKHDTSQGATTGHDMT